MEAARRVRRSAVTVLVTSLAILFAWVARPIALGQNEADTWIALWNGKNLEGWQTTGGAKWTVEDGVLVGQQGDDGRAGDIWTKDEYGDFELICTFKMVWPGNSGIWFRKPPRGMGYQMDILSMKEYGCTVGSIYSGGFLAKNTNESIVKLNDWNTVRILAEGPHIVVTLNGHKTADIMDAQYQKGKIGFQVHPGNYPGGMKIMVRECRLRPIEREVSNEVCMLCHLDFAEEELATTHLKGGVSCADCHGPSQPHIDDETRATAPDRVFHPEDTVEYCPTCHSVRKKCPTQGGDAETRKSLAAKPCTDCHGKHRIQ
ncbi:MAG: family 16 glycoside hydrolase [Armatimonadota bacterium]